MENYLYYSDPFFAYNNSLYIEKTINGKPVNIKLSNFLARITEDITCTNGAENERFLSIVGTDEKGKDLRKITVPLKNFAQLDWAQEYWGINCVIESGYGNRDNLRQAIQSTAKYAEAKTIYGTTGWWETATGWQFCMPGNSNAEVELTEKTKGYSFKTDADVTETMNLMKVLPYSVAPKEIMFPMLAYTLVSILGTFMAKAGKETKTVIMLYGKTGSMKTTLSLLINSLFGRFNEDNIPMNFRDTPKSILNYCFTLKDCAVIIDDYHPGSGREQSAQDATTQALIRGICIFDKYINTNMGANGIAKYLNQHGIAKKPRQNGTLNTFSAHFIKLVIQNPVYCGKIAFGRRKTEKINGTRNEYHIVKQDTYPVYDGIHEAIVSVEDWELAQQKRKKLGVKREKIYNLEHEHLLSGLLRCPVCGAAMYGNINRKKKPDGTIYKDHFYYACKHRMKVDGHKCDYHRQWNQTVVNGAVEEVIERLVSNPEFEKALCEKINTRVSTEGLEEELAVFKKQLNQLVMSKRKLASQMDTLDVTDRHYDKKYQDMQNRLYDFYDEIEVVEEQITELQSRIANIKEEKISGENVYLFLHYYGTMYKEFTDAEKKKFLNTFIESVEIFKEEQPNGRLLKCINFKFPVFYDGDENVTHIRWDSETTVEVVALLQQLSLPDGK